MTVKFQRGATPQYLSTPDGPNNTFPAEAWSLCFVLCLGGAYAGAENEVLFSTGGLQSGAFSVSYLGPGHSTPNSIGIQVNSASGLFSAPANSLSGASKWLISISRGSTGGMSIRTSPIRSTAPADGTGVPTYTLSGVNLTSIQDGPGATVIGGRSDLADAKFADQSLGRIFRVRGGILSTHEVARLAYGETVYDIGRTPDFYYPLATASDLNDLGPQAAHLTAYGAVTTGTDPGFGNVPAQAAAPAFSSAPAIIGTPSVGVATSYTPGTVSGSPAPTITRQWLLDGVAISGATGATYTPVAGDSGKSLAVRETATNGSGAETSTSAGVAVTAPPAFSDSFAAMTARRIYQRIGTTAKVRMSGEYNVAPATIEAQLVASADGTTVLQAWTALVDVTIGGNAWSGNLVANQGGGYRAQVRFKNSAGAVIYTSALDANSWGVGELIVGAGSSTIHGWWTSGTYPGTAYIATYRTTDGYTWKSFPSASNGIAKKIANDLALRLGVPVGMIGTGESGTMLKTWTESGNAYFAKLTSAINAQGGKIGALMVSMGSNDAANNVVVSRAAHATMLRKFIADVRALTGQPDLKVLISGFNRRLDTNDTQANYVRLAELDVGTDANVYHFPTVDMALGGDGIHLASYDASGDRVVAIFNPVLAGDSAYRRGPAITSITASGDKFRVALRHGNGTDFLPASGNSGFVAVDDTGPLTILSVARVNATALDVAVERAIGSNPRLSYMSGANPDVSAFTFDNGVVALPMDVDIGRAVAVGAPAEDTTAPVLAGSVAVTAITTTGASLSWPAASDDVGVAGYEYSNNGGASYTNVGVARTVTLSGLVASTSYSVRVRAYDAAGNRSAPLARSFTTEAEAPPGQADFDAKKVAPARKIVFPGGTRVVVFGGPVVAYPGGPYQQDGRWTIDKHPLDEFYCVADISFDLAESQTTAASVVAVAGGVQVLEQPVLQGALIAVKVGGLDELSGAANFCTLRVTLANGEQIDRTIWFAKLQGVWTVSKDPDDKRYFVADVGNILTDSGTQIASALPAITAGVTVLEQPVAQGALIMVKLGGMDVSADPLNHCTLPFICANGEKFFRTIQFNRVDN
jgi:hypothetical protein